MVQGRIICQISLGYVAHQLNFESIVLSFPMGKIGLDFLGKRAVTFVFDQRNSRRGHFYFLFFL